MWLSWQGVRHTSRRTRVRAPSRPLKWVLKYYLEVILYKCVYINDRLSLKPWMH